MKKHIDVVASVIINSEGKIFVSQRGYGEFKDFWEFPGGKIKEGESKQEALIREIKEELDADIIVKDELQIIEYSYPNFDMTMTVFICSLKSEHLVLLEHENSKWLFVNEIDETQFLNADKIIVQTLKSRNNSK